MTQKLIDLQPERLEDLIVVLSLYRPGPMKSIPVYIENKKNPANIRYIHPLLKDILGDTYGVMVYQEQVMEICRRLAGYSYGHADIVRRAMAKKKHDVMLSERDSFVRGAEANGVSAEAANAIFDEMVSFASYAFNKSHAAAYAYLSYQTAYLKCHFRGIYMAALMSSVMGNTGKLAEYIGDCKSADIDVLCPHVNRSMRGFTYAYGKMYFGLIAVKNIGGGLADRIISDREANGDFRSLQDFCERIGGRELNRKALENLIKAGAFDGLGLNRRQLLDSYDMILDMAGSGSRGVIEGQLDLFGSADTESLNMKIPFKPEFERKKLLAMEKEAAGMYLSGDPVSEYEHLSLLLRTAKTFDIACGNYKDGENVRMLCVVQERKLHVTRQQDVLPYAVRRHWRARSRRFPRFVLGGGLFAHRGEHSLYQRQGVAEGRQLFPHLREPRPRGRLCSYGRQNEAVHKGALRREPHGQARGDMREISRRDRGLLLSHGREKNGASASAADRQHYCGQLR